MTARIGFAMVRAMLVGLVISFALSAAAVPPKGDPFPLERAIAGLSGEGVLAARLDTGLGTVVIRLFDDEAPNTVANFIGLARGLRKFRDPKTGAWVKRPFYDGLTFHRAIPKFMIQAGCPRGDGRGGPGYVFDDELHPQLSHDKPGIVSMVSAGKNTNGSQFFITEVAVPHLDRVHPIFGEVIEGLDVVHAIARAEKPVVIGKVTVFRHEQEEK